MKRIFRYLAFAVLMIGVLLLNLGAPAAATSPPLVSPELQLVGVAVFLVILFYPLIDGLLAPFIKRMFSGTPEAIAKRTEERA